FTEPGIYPVELNVTDDAGNYDTDTIEVTINDMTAPEAAFSSSTTAAKTDESITFNASDTTDNIGITNYTWEFGDGNTATGANPTYSYTSPGNYTVTLTVTDAAGNEDTETLNITVEEGKVDSDADNSPQREKKLLPYLIPILFIVLFLTVMFYQRKKRLAESEEDEQDSQEIEELETRETEDTDSEEDSEDPEE
ncbi:MAG: PKD domain-containing protein, partial [Candidatus Natronoplasma sp.]